MGPILPSHVLLVIFAAAAVTVDAQGKRNTQFYA